MSATAARFDAIDALFPFPLPPARAPKEVADEAWLNERLRSAPLFEPPWDGDALLKPIRTTRTLKDASDIFGAALWRRLDWFLDGQEAAYLAQGGVKALVTLRTDPMFGWSVREIVGPGGTVLSPETEALVLGRLVEAGFRRRAPSFAL